VEQERILAVKRVRTQIMIKERKKIIRIQNRSQVTNQALSLIILLLNLEVDKLTMKIFTQPEVETILIKEIGTKLGKTLMKKVRA
jgi:hypothetical protein